MPACSTCIGVLVRLGIEVLLMASSDHLPSVIQQRQKSHRQLFPLIAWALIGVVYWWLMLHGWLGASLGLRSLDLNLLRPQYWCSRLVDVISSDYLSINVLIVAHQGLSSNGAGNECSTAINYWQTVMVKAHSVHLVNSLPACSIVAPTHWLNLLHTW